MSSSIRRLIRVYRRGSRGDLEHDPAAFYAVEGTVEVAALPGGPIEVTRSVHDQSSVRKRTVCPARESMKYALCASCIQLENDSAGYTVTVRAFFTAF